MNPTFPALSGWTDYTDAVQAYDDLTVNLREANQEVDRLAPGEPEAAKADDRAQAQAMREGTKDPGRSHTKKLKADLEAARTRVRVLTEAQSQQEAAVRALLTEHPDRAQQAAQDTLDAAADAYRDTVDEVLTAREAFWHAKGVTNWLTSPGRRYKQPAAPGLSALSSATSNGEPLSADAALAAFRGEVDPEPMRTPVAAYAIVNSYNEAGRETTKRAVPVGPDGRDAEGVRRVGTVETR